MEHVGLTVSVIVPVYNAGVYLEKCMDSILAQSFPDFELICVDDGSTDGSGERLDAYAGQDERVKVIHRAGSSGSGAVPRNIGLKHAGGEYVSILDADDWFEETMLAKMLGRARDTDADMVLCDNYLVGADGTCLDVEGELKHAFLPDRETFSYADIPDTIFQISNATAWHKLIRRGLIEESGMRFQEETPSLDDIFFVNMMDVLAKKIAVVDEKLVYYRVEVPGAQTTRVNRHKDSIYKAFAALHRGICERGIYDQVSESLKIWTVNTFCWWLSCVHEYDTYCYLVERYKEEWFDKLGLWDVNTNRLDGELLNFYNDMAGRPHELNRAEMVRSLPENGRIALYGAGEHGKKAHRFIDSHGGHDIVLWCDAAAESLGRDDVHLPGEIGKTPVDAVIIAIHNRPVVAEVREYLAGIGVARERILVYW